MLDKLSLNYLSYNRTPYILLF